MHARSTTTTRIGGDRQRTSSIGKFSVEVRGEGKKRGGEKMEEERRGRGGRGGKGGETERERGVAYY